MANNDSQLSDSSKQESLGVILKKYRKDCGLNQRDIADALGKSISTVSKMESGTHSVDIDTLSQIAKLFNTTAVRLVWESERKHLKITPVTEQLIPILDKLLDGLEKEKLSF